MPNPWSCFLLLSRLLHNPSLVSSGLSRGYKISHQLAGITLLVFSWSEHKLGLPCVTMHCGLTSLVGISTVCQWSLTVPLHSPNGRHLPAVRAVQGDCERVYLSSWHDGSTSYKYPERGASWISINQPGSIPATWMCTQHQSERMACLWSH